MAEYGQSIVKAFLESKGFVAKKIPESNIKTPDFEVYKEGELVFYCEEKTLEYDDFEGLKNDSTYNAISRHLHTAAKQFNSINPNHEVPNVLAVVNLDTLKNIHDLFISLTGYALLDNGKYMKIHKVGHRIVEDISQVDLFLWFDKGQFINFLWKDDKGKGARRRLEELFEDTQEEGGDIT
ncbi:MAG: hypothetical protein PWQ59_1473 [Thermoanaerobacterium sp.]|jgi:hypothetical protein|nr:hypothetical protein [Thermoanaerobacterium sp.]MDK2905060.1 hypothetical protein [Eubacteriaceae bacterium]MDN5300968.1 hypothetical protein [Thermoanaerobacteraceae bacterium]